MADIREAGALARAGMGIEEEADDQASVEIDAPEEVEEETHVEPETTEEEEQEDESSAIQPRKESVFQQFNEVRSQKRQAEAEKQQLLEMMGATSIEEARQKMQELQAAQPLSPEFIEAAKEMGIEDPETLKKVSDLIVGQVRKEFAPMRQNIESSASIIQEAQAQREWNESVEEFNGEWSEVLPLLEAEYKPTPTQTKAVYDYLVDISHNEEYYDKELDYILYKEQDNLEGLLGARKRKTMLTSRGQSQAVEDKGMFKRVDGSHASVLAARDRLRQIASQDDFSVESNQRI